MVSVSIITPTYNRAEIIGRAVDSIQRQTHKDAEHIVVDDGSTDGTQRLIEERNGDQIPLRYNRLETNLGANAARNRGIELANGEYISFLDSDDEYLPERLEQTVAALDDADETVAGIVHPYLIIDENGIERPSKTPSGAITLDDLRGGYPIGGFSCMLFHRSAIERIGGLDPKLPASQDYDLCIRVLKDFNIIGITKILAKCYREGGISASIERKRAAQKAIWEKHGDILSESLRNRQSYTLAHQYALAGQMADARREFWRAFRGDPGPLELYHVLLSTAGKCPFDAGMIFKRRLYGMLRSVR
jgi:glycosyltransferase involved in cell wall biosynthesis